ncbi:MauE/DoxX family redox-associated membrane protein [Plantactinospora sp. B5E13]|uniref:MauE/DoxX family redox-associated membrane protein n=1 Tax=unclassified Plantactinospora TaxID=2631981 RepID=UPI00325CCEC3
MSAVVVAAILTTSGALAISVVGKVRTRSAFAAFADAITGLRVLPPPWSRPAAAASIAAEMLVLALLFWPGGASVGLAAAVLLFGAFALVLALAIRRGATVGCHCFGPTGAPVSRRHVIRSGFLSAVSFGALVGTIAQPATSLSRLDPPQLVLACVAAGLVVAALVWLDDLVWLLRGPTHAR